MDKIKEFRPNWKAYQRYLRLLPVAFVFLIPFLIIYIHDLLIAIAVVIVGVGISALLVFRYMRHGRVIISDESIIIHGYFKTTKIKRDDNFEGLLLPYEDTSGSSAINTPILPVLFMVNKKTKKSARLRGGLWLDETLAEIAELTSSQNLLEYDDLKDAAEKYGWNLAKGVGGADVTSHELAKSHPYFFNWFEYHTKTLIALSVTASIALFAAIIFILAVVTTANWLPWNRP